MGKIRVFVRFDVDYNGDVRLARRGEESSSLGFAIPGRRVAIHLLIAPGEEIPKDRAFIRRKPSS